MTEVLQKQEAFLKKNYFTTWLATKHHKTHKEQMLNFQKFPYMRQIYLDDQNKSIMKSTQCGISEMFVVEAIGNSIMGRSIFYVLPTVDLVGRFVKNRVDKSIGFSAYYKSVVANKIAGKSEAVSLKHIGKGSIAFVGSMTPKPFTEYPADMVIIDELDQCDPANIEMAWERMSASELRRQVKTSQPTVLGFGIHKDWLDSCQYEWQVKCDACGVEVRPDFFKHVAREIDENEYVLYDKEFEWNSDRDIHLICDSCEEPFDGKGTGRWLKQKDGPHGYHVSKLFSTNVTVRELVERFNRGLTNIEVLQRFYNADLGLPYTAKGAQLDKEALDRCKADYIMGNDDRQCVIGIDVGTMLHVRVNAIMPDGRLKAVFIGTVRDEADIDRIFDRYNITAGVIDALPEKRLSERLCTRHKGLFRCFYGEVKSDTVNAVSKVVTVDRTSALDNVSEMILARNLVLPKNVESLPEYYAHMQSSTRIFDPNAHQGKGAYRWVETTPDHFFHAEGYSLIAKNLMLMMAGN